MSDVVPGAGDLVRRAGSDVELPVRSVSSTERITFGGRVITWEDLPAQTNREARRRAALLAEDVQPDRRVWHDQTHPFQVATGWRFYEDAVVLAQVRRPLTPSANGYYRSAGPWQHIEIRSRPFRGPLRRRHGVVHVANELSDTPTAPTSVGLTEQASAAEAWTYLPAPVRQAVERLVPDPDIWLGQITQQATADGVPLAQSVLVLRMSDARAVLVTADRALPARAGSSVEARRAQLARTPWLVDQAGAELAESVTRLGSG